MIASHKSQPLVGLQPVPPTLFTDLVTTLIEKCEKKRITVSMTHSRRPDPTTHVIEESVWGLSILCGVYQNQSDLPQTNISEADGT